MGLCGAMSCVVNYQSQFISIEPMPCTEDVRTRKLISSAKITEQRMGTIERWIVLVLILLGTYRQQERHGALLMHGGEWGEWGHPGFMHGSVALGLGTRRTKKY